MIIQPASGAKDLNPQQVEQNKLLSYKLSEVYKLWGYKEVSPPVIERLETLMAGGAISREDIVKIVSDESLGLRPEMTASIVRAASTRYSEKTRPMRVWANGRVFKSTKDSDAKMMIEESLESGVELFGTESMQIEVELLYLLMSALRSLNLNDENKPRLLIGHTELIRLILSQIKDEDKLDVKDSLTKIDLLKLKTIGLSEDNYNLIRAIQRLRGRPNYVIDKLKELFPDVSILKELQELFNMIIPIANEYGITIHLDPTYRPKFELYTGIMFQLVCQTDNAPLTIARGGRYDDLISKFAKTEQKSIGAGFSFSIDKIRELSKNEIVSDQNKEKVLIAFGKGNSIEKAVKVQKELHESGVVAIIELNPCENKIEAEGKLLSRGCNKINWLN